MSTIQRITGTNSGLDVDALVKSSLTTYQNKIDKETQNQKILEYQQEQYKKIMSDATDFYDKYFDILKTGNLMSKTTYNTVAFESDEKSKVTAKGFAGASVDNYTVSVTQLAAKASITLSDGATGNKTMTFGSGENKVTLDTFVVSNDGTKTEKENASITIANYNAKITAKKTELTNTLNATTTTTEEKSIIQQQLKSLNVTATYSEFSKGIVFTADQMGQGGFTLDEEPATDKELQGKITKTKDGVLQSFDLTGTSNTVTVDNVQFSLKALTVASTTAHLADLTNATGAIAPVGDGTTTTTSDGKTTTIVNSGVTTTTTTTDGTKTTITVDDGAGTITTTTQTGTDGKTTKTVTLNGGTPTTTIDTPITLTGETDVTDLKDKIVSFVNDYNTLLQSINTKIFETRDKDYMPLTDAQKEAMTEDQITAWEKKAQTGLLRKDSDLERITSAMKTAMSSVMSGSDSYLEQIGITPVKNYTDKNGMFTIDESKLTQALEDNAGNVKDLFTRLSNTDTNEKGGVLTQLASALKSEFKTSTSSLSKKAGWIGSSTEYNNILTTNIYKKKLLIADLNDKFTDKETALYNKYSALETALQTLSSQQASLSSMLGTS